jgi:histidinol-phosphate aminotransferase
MATQRITGKKAGLSRRGFLKSVGIGGALGAVALSEHDFAWAQFAGDGDIDIPQLPSNAVLLNANENPLGPSAGARSAITEAAVRGGRFDVDGETDRLIQTFCKQNGLKQSYVAVYPGSSQALHYAGLAFCSPAHGYVCADPTFEAGVRAAKLVDAQIKLVKLREDYSHDVHTMATADTKAGLIYVCNPNNPTGTVTSYDDISWLVDNRPKGSIVLVDEAYIQYTDAKSVIDKVVADKDIIVLRTFSKIYGMAGIRCGLAVGRPDLLAKLAAYGINSMAITSTAPARVSLQEANLVPRRKRVFANIRQDMCEWLAANNYGYIPSVTNCVMIDTKRPAQEVIDALQKKSVFVGRVWPSMPSYVRVTIGTQAEMDIFKTALREVMQEKLKAKPIV